MALRVLASLFLLVAPALGGTVVLKDGTQVFGTVFLRGAEIVVNPYHSPNPKMRYGLLHFAKDEVDHIVDDAPAPDASGSFVVPRDPLFSSRVRRSAALGKGVDEDRLLSMRVDAIEERALYTILVPKSYDPRRPTPLLVALHGGGARGRDGRIVAGSGAEALGLYRVACEKRGWICVCPSAVVPDWSANRNETLLDAVLDEVEALYDVDLNRVYLTGHSMGGAGVWAEAARRPEVWAAVAATSSYAIRGIDDLVRTRTAFYVYHGAEDERTPVEAVRKALSPYAGTDVDFADTELPGRGHELPAPIVGEMFDFLASHRLSVQKSLRYVPSSAPRSSFARPLSRDEERYLPSMTGTAPRDLPALLEDLRIGGGVAERAIPALVARPGERVAIRVARICDDPASPPDVREAAVRILAERHDAHAREVFDRALSVETDDHALLTILDAMGDLRDPVIASDLVDFLRHRLAYYRRRLRKGRIDFGDWATALPPIVRACDLLASFPSPRAGPLIDRAVVRGILLDPPVVDHDIDLEDPLPAARELARSACAALAACRQTDALEDLRRLAANRDPVLAAAGRLAAERLGG